MRHPFNTRAAVAMSDMTSCTVGGPASNAQQNSGVHWKRLSARGPFMASLAAEIRSGRQRHLTNDASLPS